MLRAAIAVIGILCFVCGLVMMFLPDHAGIGLLIFGGLVLLSLFFEGHYNSSRVATKGAFEPTGEKFIDPGTGRLVEVEYDAETGERNYRQT